VGTIISKPDFFVSAYFVMNKFEFAKLITDAGFLKYLYPSRDKHIYNSLRRFK